MIVRRFPRFRAPRREPPAVRETIGASAREGRRLREWSQWGLPAAAVIVLHLLVFPPSRSVERIQVEVGTITSQEIRAPFSFAAPRPSYELEEARRMAAQRIEPIYRLADGAERRVQESLTELFDEAQEQSQADSPRIASGVGRLHDLFPGIEVRDLSVLLDPDRAPAIRDAMLETVAALYQRGIVDLTPRGTYQNVRIVRTVADAEEDRRIPVTDVVFAVRLEEELREALRPRLQDDRSLEAAVAIGVHLVLPNLNYDDAETERLRALAVGAVPVEKEFLPREIIVNEGVRVTRDHVAVLEALEQARIERALAQDASIAIRLQIGRIILVALILFASFRLVRQVDPQILVDRSRYLLLNLLLAAFVTLSALAVRQPGLGGPVAVPIALLAMLATILFGEASAYRIAATGILLLGIVPELASPLVLVWAGAATVAIRMLRRVRNRNQFYRALAAVAATYLVAVTAMELGGSGGLGHALRMAAIGVASGAASMALTLFVLPLLEALFGVTTELTLLELSDLNHPLLRRMSLESPGTFHHSQVVGTLAEAGARAIGANSLLTRVGSNFHDIGKLLKPRYFAENQNVDNPHDELAPSMSALVIASHVKEGVELGRQWGLPWTVLAFIPEHHGTSVMQYFYRKALERDDAGAVKVDDYRYPGPKPQTRETAILMLADGVEAACRSLRRPTASRIREMTRKIIEQKMAEGQLDECGLTLRELALIRESFVPILVGIHHQRVAYPGQREHEELKERESREARARARRSGTSVATGS
jgi:putative nucleotidyltransferase with HDIG domain